MLLFLNTFCSSSIKAFKSSSKLIFVPDVSSLTAYMLNPTFNYILPLLHHYFIKPLTNQIQKVLPQFFYESLRCNLKEHSHGYTLEHHL